MIVFKPNFIHLIRILIIGIILSLIGHLVVGNGFIVIALLLTIFSLIPSLMFVYTNKLYLNTEEIYIKGYTVKSYYGCRWNEVIRVDWMNNMIYLKTLEGKSVKVTRIWQNYENLWMRIYEEIVNHHNQCMFDEHFIKWMEDKRS